MRAPDSGDKDAYLVVAVGPWHVLLWMVEALADDKWKMCVEGAGITIMHNTKVGSTEQANVVPVFMRGVGNVLKAGPWMPLVEATLLQGIKLNRRELQLLAKELFGGADEGVSKRCCSNAGAVGFGFLRQTRYPCSGKCCVYRCC